jgi:hypothetical protein
VPLISGTWKRIPSHGEVTPAMEGNTRQPGPGRHSDNVVGELTAGTDAALGRGNEITGVLYARGWIEGVACNRLIVYGVRGHADDRWGGGVGGNKARDTAWVGGSCRVVAMVAWRG